MKEAAISAKMASDLNMAAVNEMKEAVILAKVASDLNTAAMNEMREAVISATSGTAKIARELKKAVHSLESVVEKNTNAYTASD
jgi:hypothetical protein